MTVAELTTRLRGTEKDLQLATSAVEGVSAGRGLEDTFSDAVAARNFDSILTQTKAEYTARIHTLEAHARQLEAALRGGGSFDELPSKTVSHADSSKRAATNGITSTGTQTGVMQTAVSTQTVHVGVQSHSVGSVDTKPEQSARVRARHELLADEDITAIDKSGSADQVSVASASTALAAAYSKTTEQNAEILEMRKALQNAADDKAKMHNLNCELALINQQWYAKFVQARDAWQAQFDRQKVRSHRAHS